MGTFQLPKKERLHKGKPIDTLFAEGISFSVFPLKVLFLPHPDRAQKSHEILVTVPSRTFKRAVARNKIKRRLREGYRLNKATLSAPPAFYIGYIYIAREMLPSAKIHAAVRSSLEKIRGYEKKD